MSFFATLKANAKRALRNNWGSAVLVHLVPFLLFLSNSLLTFLFGLNFPTSSAEAGVVFTTDGILVSVDIYQLINSLTPMLIGIAVLAIFNFLISGPVLLGITYWYAQITYGKTEPASKVFHYFENPKRYFRSLGFTFQLACDIFSGSSYSSLFPPQ